MLSEPSHHGPSAGAGAADLAGERALAEPELIAGPQAGAPAVSPRARRLALVALLLLVPAPSVGVALAMMLDSTQGTLVGQGAYVLSKVWILALPLLWLKLVERQPFSWSPARKGGFGTGIALGLAISAAIVLGYWLIGRHYIDAAMLRDAVNANGIGHPAVYIAFTFGYLSLVNALLEEYVWRWFVFRQCEKLVGGPAAVICSALFFTIHHVLALHAQMGWVPTVLGSAGVFIGGAVWSWCYLRFRSVWPGYVSHLIVDFAVFGVGWWIIFN
jgi:hypothetical protein